MRREKAAYQWLERKNMASLSGCKEEVNGTKRRGESETEKNEENMLGAQSSSCFLTNSVLD